MSIVGVDGTSYYTTATAGQRATISSSPVVQETSGMWSGSHRSGRWLMNSSSDVADIFTNNTHTTFICQFFMYRDGQYDRSGTDSIAFRNEADAIDHIQVVFHRDGRIEFFRGGSASIAITTKGVWTDQVWHYYEMKVRISDTIGVIQCRVNGELVVDEQGLDTRNGGTDSWVDGIRMREGNALNSYFQQFVFMNGDGVAPFNDFIGQKRIYTLFPNASGSHQAWTRSSTGSTNWQLVDETAPDGNSTFVESDSTGTIDMYNFESLSTTCTVVDAVIVNTSAIASSTGANYGIRHRIDSTGSIATSTNFQLSTSGYFIYQSVFSTNPDSTAGWTPAAVNLLMAGMEVST